MKVHTKAVCEDCGHAQITLDYTPPKGAKLIETCNECGGTHWALLKVVEVEEQVHE